MDDTNKTICDDFVKQKASLFLDDLLTEKEYREFADHLKMCDRCNARVRSVSALSNHLWKLGKVQMPSDLETTILYQLDHPEEARASKSSAWTVVLAVTAVLALLGLTVFLVIQYVKDQPEAKGREGVSISAAKIQIVKAVEYSELSSDQEKKVFSEPMAIETPQVTLLKVKETARPLSNEDYSLREGGLTADVPEIRERELVESPVLVQPLHWHLQYAKEIDNVQGEAPLEKVQQQIEQVYSGLDSVKEQIAELEAEKESTGLKLGERYTSETKTAKSEQVAQLELTIQEKVSQKEQLEEMIERLKKEKEGLESGRQQSDDESRRRATHRIKVLNIVSLLGIMPDYQDDHLVVFKVDAGQLKSLREQIDFASQGTFVLRDYDSGGLTAAPADYLVSLYFPKEENPALHWHLAPSGPDSVSDIWAMIEKKNASIHYKSEDVIVFAVHREAAEALRASIKSREPRFAEFGYAAFAKGLSNGVGSDEIKISISLKNR